MTIKIEERPGERLVCAVVGGTFEEFEIRKVPPADGEPASRAVFHYFVDDLEVPAEVYRDALETSRANRLALDMDDDGGPVEAIEEAVH